MNANLALAEPSAHTAVAGGASTEDTLVEEFVRAKLVFTVPLLVVSLGSFIALATLAGFGRDTLVQKAFGPLNVGFLFIICEYGLILALATVYLRVARAIFDPIADKLCSRTGEAA